MSSLYEEYYKMWGVGYGRYISGFSAGSNENPETWPGPAGNQGDDYVIILEEKAITPGNVQVLRENGFEVDSQGALGTEYALTAKRLLH